MSRKSVTLTFVCFIIVLARSLLTDPALLALSLIPVLPSKKWFMPILWGLPELPRSLFITVEAMILGMTTVNLL